MYFLVYQIVHLRQGSSCEEPVPREDPFVSEFGAVQFDLNIFTVDYGITGEEEGHGVFRPFFSGEHLGDDLLEHLTLVPFRIIQQIGGTNQKGFRKKGFQIGIVRGSCGSHPLRCLPGHS